MEKIPIKLEYKGKQCIFFFENALGAGREYTFQLYYKNFYFGELFYTPNYFWQYYGNHFNGMGDFFGDYVTAWYDSHAQDIDV